MIRDPEMLRRRIKDAEAMAARLEYRGLNMNLGERRVVAQLLRELAEVARRAFSPHAREDWGVIPREPDDDATVPGLFG